MSDRPCGSGVQTEASCMHRMKATSPYWAELSGRAGTKRVADRRVYESLLLRLETMPRSESFERKVLRLIPSSSAHFA